jgi:MFS family permease
MIIGIANDKWGSKKYGNRFPWIMSFGIIGALWWIMIAIYLPIDQNIYLYLAFYYFMISLGTAFSDTALDGLILDVTPKEKLGKVQGFTWMCLLLGMGAGGILLGLIFLALNMVPFLFALTGCLMIVACFFTKLVKEPPFKQISSKRLSKDLVSIFTKKKNWKVILYTFTSSMTGLMITTFFTYLILIAINVIDVEKTILSITSGNAVEYLGWSSVFYFFSGLGTVIGSVVAGRYADINRRKAVLRSYIIYIPFCLISILPFVITGQYMIALVYGLIGQIIFGAITGAFLIVGQTIRGDIVRKEYPEIKSTYYAFLISSWNAGQTIGQLIGAFLFSYFALNFPDLDFYSLYFILSLFGAGFLIINFLLFKSIDPRDYEFEHILGEKKEVYFG